MNNVVKKLSTTRLTRQEFLTYVVAIIIGILGIPSILNLISNTTPNKKVVAVTKQKNNGYGSGAYGV